MPTVTPKSDITLSLSVSDRQKTAEWFAAHFGFELIYDAPEIGWCEMTTNTPGVTLGFGDTQDVAHGNCVPVFGVEDIRAARAALEDAGVAFDGDTLVMEGMVKLATFYDPDRNAFMLAEDLSSHS